MRCTSCRPFRGRIVCQAKAETTPANRTSCYSEEREERNEEIAQPGRHTFDESLIQGYRYTTPSFVHNGDGGHLIRPMADTL